MNRGLVLGKFMPPHAGHLRLFDFAKAYVDALTILVCSRPTDQIPGHLRHEWVSGMYPGCRVRHFAESADPGDLDDPDFWDRWRTNIRSLHPEPIDYLITPEDYGRLLGDKLDARYIRAPDRGLVSGTDIRADPFGCWHALPSIVRPYYARQVCVSTTGSARGRDLGTALAAIYQTEFVARYEPVDALDVDLARGQEAANWVGALRANRVLFVAADALTLSGAPPRSTEIRPTDLYIHDTCQSSNTMEKAVAESARAERFFSSSTSNPDFGGAPVVLVDGSPAERLRRAIAAIEAVLPELRGYATGRTGLVDE